MKHPVRIELTREGFLVKVDNNYITQRAHIVILSNIWPGDISLNLMLLQLLLFACQAVHHGRLNHFPFKIILG